MTGIAPARSSIVASARRADRRSTPGGSAATATRLHATIFLAYGLGVFGGGVTELRWLLSAIYLPITLVSIVIVTAFVCFHRPGGNHGHRARGRSGGTG